MSRVTFSAPQTQALVSLLCTIGTANTIDIREVPFAIVVTVWRQGESTSWEIMADGDTGEVIA